MVFLQEDEERLKKFKIVSILDLALGVPQKYEDTTLNRELVENEFCTLHCEVLSKRRTPKSLVFDLRLLSHNRGEIKAIFFSPKSYQQNIFSVGETLFLYGKISRYPELSVIHPKKITNIGEINKIYVGGVQNRSYKLLVSKYLTLENIMSSGLDKETSANILKIHFPTKMADIYENGKLKNALVESLKIAEIYYYLFTLSSKQIRLPAKKVKPASLDSFFVKLPFTPTKEQMAAIEDCKKDLQKDEQAKRVVIGDVGCGKTVVILALAQMTGAKKTAILAPTAILANQIYEEAKKYLTLSTLLVTQSSKAKEEDIAKADLLVGTHALLYKKLPACQTLIVDEQHRFGVAQRALISKLTGEGSFRPHYFQFTATPIPRTQALIEATLADMTTIKETPIKKNIETKVIFKEDFKELLVHIKTQIGSGFQVAIIYPLVEKSETSEYMSLYEAEDFWKKRFEKVFVTHGKDDAKEHVFLEFRDGGELILATTVMEVGVSLPKLSTIVVVGAEKLGLASLHQLRGRVARNSANGWCFLYTKSAASERLKKFAVTKSGFEIAELDLQYRDSGDLLSGEKQSGRRFEWFDIKTDEIAVKAAKEMLSVFVKKAYSFSGSNKPQVTPQSPKVESRC